VKGGRDATPLFPYPRQRRFQADLRRGQGGRLESRGAGTASRGCVRPLAGIVKIDDLLIVLD